MLTMIVEQAAIETGEVLNTSRITQHGWASPGAAVKHWRTLSSFTAYRNGRVTVNANTGVATRAYFEVTP